MPRRKRIDRGRGNQDPHGNGGDGPYFHNDSDCIEYRAGAVLASALVNENELYSLIGEGGFQRLVAAFYCQVPSDDLLGPMYQGRDLTAAEQRLREFLIFRFGGPERYIELRGHPRLRARHAPFWVDQAGRDRWLRLMNNALAEVQLPAEAEQILRAYFESTGTFLINRQ